MADQKTTDLTAITTFSGDETFYVVEDDDGTPVSRKVTVEDVGIGLAKVGNVYRLIDEDTVVVTSGNVTLNATAVTDISTTQITLNGAVAGDIVFYEVSMLISAANSTKGFDAYTYPSGTRTNAFGPGVSASLGSTGGFQAWFHAANSSGFDMPRSGSARRVLVSGDISGGNVVVGLAYAGTNSTAKTLYAVANNPLQAHAQLWRPPT